MDKIVILGGRESGLGAAILAISKGIKVLVSDNRPIPKTYKDKLEEYCIKYEENGHSTDEILSADGVIKSPGIADGIDIIKKITSKNIPIMSEIEFAYGYTDAKIVAITGSNGKTTTTKLVYEILKNEGMDVAIGGNIGNSFAYQVAKHNPDIYVLELSSFQLDGIKNFRPDIAILLNITADHLDRYQNDIKNYIRSKFRICQNQTNNDYLIYSEDDSNIVEYLKKNTINSQKLGFSILKKKSTVGLIENDRLSLKCKKHFNMPLNLLKLRGSHNVKNIMAAGISSILLNVRNNILRETLQNFEGVEHRMENVRTIGGVRYINDSKATNVNATLYAIESLKPPIIWIAGGVDKGNDYRSHLFPLACNRVSVLICLGKDNSKLKSIFENNIPQIIETDHMKEAIYYANKLAKPNDTVLLSPACASFDIFNNYEDRGTQFKTYVNQLR